MKAALLATALTLAACAPTISYDLDQPLVLRVDAALAAQPLADAAAWRSDFAAIAAQLGSSVTDDASATTNQPIVLVYDTDCSGLQAAHVDGEEDVPARTSSTIHICYGFLDRDYLWPEILAHEVGHVLGAPHLPCTGRNVMCRTAPRDVPQYSADDLAAICVWTRGGVCGR